MFPAGGNNILVFAHMGDDMFNKLVVFALCGDLRPYFYIAAVHIAHFQVSEQNIVQLTEVFDNIFLNFVRIFL